MSFLAPLFMLAATAVALPVLFHLIRRTPRGRTLFSSLMFLDPSPPRLTRRSRLDQLLLLLLRASALILLALAFARPFLREAENLSYDGAPGRRVVLLLDTSASMRRGDLWQQALSTVREESQRIEEVDDLALLTFDEEVHTIVDFDTDRTTSGREKAGLVRRQLAALAPSWNTTHLGEALLAAADGLTIANDLQQSEAALQIILISDLQKGADVSALQSFEWPSEVTVATRHLQPYEAGNATLRIVTSEGTELEDEVRVRVTNAADSANDQFYLDWQGVTPVDSEGKQNLAIYVPAGQTTIVHVPRAEPSVRANRLVLSGDREDFDNQFFTVPIDRQQVKIGYIGDDSVDDPEGLRYYLELAYGDTYSREITVVPMATDQSLDWHKDAAADLIVIARAVAPELLPQLDAFIRQGGCVLTVLNEQATAVQLVSFIEHAEVVDAPANRSEDYVMLGEIDFSHPLFAVFAQPQYNDFTKIHFWKHIRVKLGEDPQQRVLARFDNGSPALWEQRLGEGRLFVLTSGWSPSDSQLALSSKFVPLLSGILDQASRRTLTDAEYTVGDSVQLLPHEGELRLQKPDGQIARLSSDQQQFRDADQPGIYTLQVDGRDHSFAVNLASRESETAPLDITRLEQLGVQVGDQPTQSEKIERERQLRDIELEGQQKLWQWFVVCVLGLLCFETWIAGRRARI